MKLACVSFTAGGAVSFMAYGSCLFVTCLGISFGIPESFTMLFNSQMMDISKRMTD